MLVESKTGRSTNALLPPQMTVLEAIKFKNNTMFHFLSMFHMDSVLISFNALSLSSKTINIY